VLRGGKYTDPIDKRNFRFFLPYGYINQRENAMSPSTLSLERHRLLWLFLENETDFFGGFELRDAAITHREKIYMRSDPSQKLNVLHFAPEQEFYKRFRKQDNISYKTADLLSPLADVKVDICSLPFDDDMYDVIICNHVLEHIQDDLLAMRELYRVMKPGGMGIFQVPQDLSREFTFSDDSITDRKEREKIFGQYDHVRVYGRDYCDRLRSVGFRVDEVDYTQMIGDALVRKYCLMKGEILPVCFK
jgi:predicted SAM-dependent methyltransferase